MQTFVQVNAEAHRAVSRLYLLGPEVEAAGIVIYKRAKVTGTVSLAILSIRVRRKNVGSKGRTVKLKLR